MKHIARYLVPLFGLTLSSCFIRIGGNDDSKLTDKDLPVYDLHALATDGATAMDDYLLSTKTFHISNEYDGAAYMSLSEYADLISLQYADGYHHKLEKSGSQQSYLMLDQGNYSLYQIIVDYSSSAFVFAGSLSSAMKNGTDLSKASLSMDVQSDYSYAVQGGSYTTASFAKNVLPTYRGSKDYYAPISLLDAQLGNDAGVYHFYTPDAVYQYSDVEELKTTFTLNGKSTTATAGWESYYEENKKMAPGVALGDYDVIQYTFNNLYGLKYLKYPRMSFSAVLASDGTDKLLKSTDPNEHLQGIINAFAVLDDDHTGLQSISPWWGEDVEKITFYRGPNSINRAQSLATLKTARQAVYEEESIDGSAIRYSTDQKVAMFAVDGFTFSYNAYEEDGKTIKEDLYTEDTFYYLVHQFETIKDKGGVEDVILDLSVNGGGVLGVLIKMLALISDANVTDSYILDTGTESVTKIESKVDSNRDGKYDAEDVYGDDFKIHVLTSTCSFSCGNAFPFYAQIEGSAQIIGEKSGGGECLVGSKILPSGSSFVHSSNNHIGIMKDQGFLGDESGAEPDVAIDYDHFYDIDYLQKSI